jgi:hypothetical protein
VYTKFKPKTRGEQRTWKLEGNILKLFEDLDLTAWTLFNWLRIGTRALINMIKKMMIPKSLRTL